MAGTGVWIRLLERHRARLTKDPDMNRVVPKLIKRGFFSNVEERQLASVPDASERTDLVLDKLSRDPDAFRGFCMTLEECAPHLLTELLFDRGEIFVSENPESDNQALQLGFELVLKERDVAVREQARTAEDLLEARRRLDAVQAERDRAVSSLENLAVATRLDKPANPKRFEGRTASGSSLRKGSLDSDPQLVEENGDNVVWQIYKVTLQRVANYGFGIAVSGGYDSVHFASGDPSVAISDVLKAGPAEGRLQLNDRIISVNGISLENVNHSTAIQVLKNSGDSVHLVVRRRVVMPTAVEKESPPLKVTLIRKNKKDDFGLVLGCRFFIQDLTPDSLAAQDGGLKTGDTILKMNNTPLDGLSLTDVKKLIDKSKDRLQLIVSKSHTPDERLRSSANRSRDDEGYATFRPPHDRDDVNIYRPSVRAEEPPYPEEPPPGAYPPSAHARYDGRYVYDHEGPPRPPLPGTFPREGPNSPARDPVRPDDFYAGGPRREPDGYYSDHDMEGFHGPADEDMFGRPHDERYVGLRSDVRTDIRRVVFHKDRQKGLGLRLAGGNATGIFIASVQPGSAAEAEGLVEGDQILQANGRDIVGLTREEAVAHLTSLEGQVTLLVQYKKEDYDSIMASHEAGDSFYIRTHLSYQPTPESNDHAFKAGDIFHIKDTLFRGVGGSWLAIRVGSSGEEVKKGTIPNSKKAESLASAQQENVSSRDTLPSKGRGGLFKRKSARRAKSLGKDHWEEVIFSGLATKFPPYERVVLRDPAFVRPVVVFGAIADVARDMLLQEFPDRFESPQADKGAESDAKKDKLGVIRFGAIREAINRQKHCVLDVMPYHVDRLNYAQYYPIVVFLKGESKQAIKDVRSRWRGAGGTTKNPKKLQEHNERMDNLFSHLFTGSITHTTTDVWFPKLVEMIQAQQRRPVWMSQKKPEEDFNDDLMFPMPNRNSMAAAPDSEFDLARPSDDLNLSPTQKKQLVRSSSDPSINTGDRVPGIPPYPAPPGYKGKMPPYNRDDYDDYRHPASARDGDWQMHPEDRYYPHPHHQSQQWSPHPPPHHQQAGYPQHSRSNIDVYATITPSERARNRPPDNGEYPGGPEDFGPPRDRVGAEDPYRMTGPRSPHTAHMSPTHPAPGDHRGYNDGSSNDNDSYSRYVSSPANKHDDSKLRDKFGGLQVGGGRERSPASHDPYRFTRSTANPVSNANIDRAKLSHLTAKYRQGDPAGKAGGGNKAGGPPTSPPGPVPDPGPGAAAQKKKEPPPVPAKTYSLKEVGLDLDEMKARNYENSNRSYNYSDIHYPNQQPPPPSGDPRYHHHHDPHPPHSAVDSPYEYISARAVVNSRPSRSARDEVPPQLPPPPREDYDYDPSHNPRAFSNSVYMDHRDVERARSGVNEMDPDPYQPGYTRPRTDDEQLREREAQRQHRTRSASSASRPADQRARSETRLHGAARWNKYKSWDTEQEGQRTFDSYKKLITPGFYGNKKSMSKSHDELREGPSAGVESRERSAFEAYRTSSSGPSLPAGGHVVHPGSQDDFGGRGELEEGQTVVATARGVFTSAGGVLTSHQTGVSIVIPEGALDAGVTQEIYFKVCSGNSILPPLDEDKGETLLSPLVMCGPHGLSFNKPVELRLPHSASVNPESWSFALKSSDSPSGQPTQWQNVTLAGSEGVAQGHVNQSSVSVMVDHF
ncbi:tight junction protein ZO-1-like isoform X2 [Littorina saxatilis]|uniref:tight junction protein ZO-1-like isoform X2 n=1 Tax=Littorina saxatilis TaxID=31220 RepID=UPI0038B55206